MEGASLWKTRKNDVRITTKLWKKLWKKKWKTKNDVKITTKNDVKITNLISVKIIKGIDLLKIGCIIANNADPPSDYERGECVLKKVKEKIW